MVLVDSSVWIRIQQNRLRLSEYVAPDEDLATCPMVVHEVLRGARDQIRYDALYDALIQLTMLDEPMPLLRFEEAAQIYRRCRERGVTPATADCIIAATAIAHNAQLLQLDTDFRNMARVIPSLQLLTRS